MITYIEIILEKMSHCCPYLTTAVDCDHLACISTLIANGAFVDEGSGFFAQTHLYIAVARGSHVCAETLISHGADVNTRDLVHNTPLHIAVQNGHIECVRTLLSHGADFDAINVMGESIMDMATNDEVKELIQKYKFPVTKRAI